MRWRFVICEGIDDLRAVRGVAQRCYGYTRWTGQDGRFRGRSQVLRVDGTDRVLEVADGRDRLRAAKEAHELLHEADGTTVAVGLLLDPDEDDDEALVSFVKRHALAGLTSHPTNTPDGVWLVESAFGALTPFTSLAWDTPRTFDGLPDTVRVLERTAVAILQDAREADAKIVLSLLDQLQKAGRSVNWKTAHRLFNAVVAPATEDGFMDRVFGQDRKTRNHLATVLGETMLGERLRWLLEDAGFTK